MPQGPEQGDPQASSKDALDQCLTATPCGNSRNNVGPTWALEADSILWAPEVLGPFTLVEEDSKGRF